MSSPIAHNEYTSSSDEEQIRNLYQQLLIAWNKRNEDAMAELFTEDGDLVGFDGSQISRREEILSHIRDIFANHLTPSYVSKVRSVRFLGTTVAILQGVAGMVPPGQTDIVPALNAIQTLVAFKGNSQWRVSLFQNTPAQFHGRPEMVQALTDELRMELS